MREHLDRKRPAEYALNVFRFEGMLMAGAVPRGPQGWVRILRTEVRPISSRRAISE